MAEPTTQISFGPPTRIRSIRSSPGVAETSTLGIGAALTVGAILLLNAVTLSRATVILAGVLLTLAALAVGAALGAWIRYTLDQHEGHVVGTRVAQRLYVAGRELRGLAEELRALGSTEDAETGWKERCAIFAERAEGLSRLERSLATDAVGGGNSAWTGFDVAVNRQEATIQAFRIRYCDAKARGAPAAELAKLVERLGEELLENQFAGWLGPIASVDDVLASLGISSGPCSSQE